MEVGKTFVERMCLAGGVRPARSSACQVEHAVGSQTLQVAVLPESEGCGGMTANAPRIARSHQELRRRVFSSFANTLSVSPPRRTVIPTDAYVLACRVLAQDASVLGNQLQACVCLPQIT
jgi:hypothetical protein